MPGLRQATTRSSERMRRTRWRWKLGDRRQVNSAFSRPSTSTSTSGLASFPAHQGTLRYLMVSGSRCSGWFRTTAAWLTDCHCIWRCPVLTGCHPARARARCGGHDPGVDIVERCISQGASAQPGVGGLVMLPDGDGSCGRRCSLGQLDRRPLLRCQAGLTDPVTLVLCGCRAHDRGEQPDRARDERQHYKEEGAPERPGDHAIGVVEALRWFPQAMRKMPSATEAARAELLIHGLFTVPLPC